MRLTSEITASITYQGEEVVFTLRQPTNKEINEFLSARWETGRRGGIKDRSNEVRCKLFDGLFLKVDNLEDKEGHPITPETKELIPGNWKSTIVFSLFEDMEIDIKN